MYIHVIHNNFDDLYYFNQEHQGDLHIHCNKYQMPYELICHPFYVRLFFYANLWQNPSRAEIN